MLFFQVYPNVSFMVALQVFGFILAHFRKSGGTGAAGSTASLFGGASGAASDVWARIKRDACEPAADWMQACHKVTPEHLKALFKVDMLRRVGVLRQLGQTLFLSAGLQRKLAALIGLSHEMCIAKVWREDGRARGSSRVATRRQKRVGVAEMKDLREWSELESYCGRVVHSLHPLIASEWCDRGALFALAQMYKVGDVDCDSQIAQIQCSALPFVNHLNRHLKQFRFLFAPRKT